MNLSGSYIKEGVGCIFESCDISLKNMPTSHTVSLALVICACSDSELGGPYTFFLIADFDS